MVRTSAPFLLSKKQDQPGKCRLPGWFCFLSSRAVDLLGFLLSAENGIDGCATDSTMALESGLAILHCDSLGVFHLRLLLALYAIVQVCHSFKPP